MTKQHITNFMIWVAIVLASTTAFAQTQIPAKQPALQAGDVLEFYWLREPAPAPKACYERIANASVLLAVEGNGAAAEQVLREVWLRCSTNNAFTGQDDLLVQVAIARAKLFQSQGRHAEALRASQQLIPQKTDIPKFVELREKLELADKADLIRAANLANDPRLVKLRQELSQADERVDPLATIVYNAYFAGEFFTIVEIGPPAQPAFMAEILKDLGTLPPDTTRDPLFYFIRMNERRAAELLLANLNAGGYLWRRRIIRCMERINVLQNKGTWSSQLPSVCLEPEWLSLLEALLSSPDTALQSVGMITEPFVRDQLTPGLQRALVYGIQKYEPEFTNALLKALDQQGVVESARPVLEALAKHKDPRVQQFAAPALANYELSGALLEMASNPSPLIRATVASTLRPHEAVWLTSEYQEHNGKNRTNFDKRFLYPTLEQEHRDVLTRLAQDSDASVRRAAARALGDLTPPLEDSIYVQLSSDLDSQVRQAIARMTTLKPELRSSILLRLATDSDDTVRKVVDGVFDRAPLATDPSPYFDALKLRLFDPQNPMSALRFNVVHELIQTPVGIQAFVSWLLEQETPQVELLADLLNSQGYERILGLEDQELQGLFGLACEYKGDDGFFQQKMLNTISNARPSRGDAMRLVLANEGLNTATRLTAAELAALDGGSEFTDAFMDLLREGYWKSNAPNRDDMRSFERTVKRMPVEGANRMLLQVIQDTQIPDSVAKAVAQYYSESAPLGREVTLAVLERWFAATKPHTESVEKAIVHLAALPEDAGNDLLNAAALHPDYSVGAVRTIISLRRAACLPVLERCLKAEWVADSAWRRKVRLAAANGIPSFLTDEAGEILLRGLASSDGEVRARCGVGLSYIEETRERTRRWQDSKDGKPSKESALAELLVMLDDENIEVRVQAIHGVATFDAIEYLPTLIRLLKDPDAKIVEAAREAISDLSLAAKSK